MEPFADHSLQLLGHLRTLVIEVGGKEATEFFGQFVVFWGAEEPSVRHRLEDMQLRIDAARAKLSVHPNGIGQEKVTGSGL